MATQMRWIRKEDQEEVARFALKEDLQQFHLTWQKYPHRGALCVEEG